MTRRLRVLAPLAVLVAVSLGAAACGSSSGSASSTTAGSNSGAKPAIVFASQNFDEDLIVAQIYGQLLEANGFKVSYKKFKDRASIYSAVYSGDANFVPDYAASGLEFLDKNKGLASPEIQNNRKQFDIYLKPHKLQTLDPTNAVDTNAFVVTKATADSKHLTSISDLTDTLKLGGPQDCPTNAGCLPALKKVYGIDLSKNFVPLDSAGPLTVKALQQGDIDVAVLFSTGPAIAANGWRVLRDDKKMFNADNIVPVVTDTLAGNATLKSLVNKASALLTTDNVTAMNKRYDIDKEDEATIAKDFLTQNKLTK